jgi:hypothetical protein
LETFERIIAASTRGIYESNYLKANAPDGSGAFWLKHNVLSPPEGSEMPAAAELWCVLWLAEEGWRPRVWKRVVGLEDVELATDRVAIDVGVVRLEPDHATGEMPGGGAAGDEEDAISWDLRIRDELPPLHHLASAWMYEKPFPRKKVVTGSPRAIFDGSFTLGERTLDVGSWVGHRNHNWGTEHAERYVYGSCNLWDDGADLTVEGFTVKVRLAGPVRSPWLTLLRGLEEGSPYGRGTVWAMLQNSGEVAWPRWIAWGGGRHGGLRLEMRLDPDHVAGLRYLHPDGAVSYCYNAKDAAVNLVRGGVRHTSRAGELEFLVPDPVEGIALHGHASLDELRADLSG